MIILIENIANITREITFFPDAKRFVEIYIRGLQLDRLSFLKELSSYDERFTSEVEIASIPVSVGTNGRIYVSPPIEKYIQDNGLSAELLLKSGDTEEPLKLKLLQIRRLIADAKQDTNDVALHEFLKNINVNNERALKEV